VAQRTVTATSRYPQFNRLVVFHVGCGGSVAYFARHVPVEPLGFRLRQIIVAVCTRDLPGKLDLVGYRLLNRRSAVVSIFSKIFRNQTTPDCDNQSDYQYQKDQQARGLLGNPGFEQFHKSVYMILFKCPGDVVLAVTGRL